VLLSGWRFKKQLIPYTFDLLPLAFLGVIFSAGMQFLLAWYLWTRLPVSSPHINGNGAVLKPYPGTEGKRCVFEALHPFASSPLPTNEYPNYRFANDVCRTLPVVQLVCITIKLVFSRKVHKNSRTREMCFWISNFTHILILELFVAFTMADDWIRPCAPPPVIAGVILTVPRQLDTVSRAPFSVRLALPATEDCTS
jgi:hypothetical protein